jgi:FMN reductase
MSMREAASGERVLAVGISGSPSASSKSRTLLELALAQLAAQGVATRLVDLATLSADGLLGRTEDAGVEEALETASAALIVVASTPVYRATYSGLLKVFFDRLQPRSLDGRIGIAIATGGVPGHLLVLDHGLRPLFGSLGCLVVPTGIYGTDAQFTGGTPETGLVARVERAVAEAVALARAPLRPLPSPDSLEL